MSLKLKCNLHSDDGKEWWVGEVFYLVDDSPGSNRDFLPSDEYEGKILNMLDQDSK